MAGDAGDFAERREILLQGIEQDQEEMREAVHDLAEVAENTVDLSVHIRQSPMSWLAGAFCVGLWLGMRGNNRFPPARRPSENGRTR